MSTVPAESGVDARRRALGYALVVIAAISWGTWPLILRGSALAPSLQAAIVMAILTVVSGALTRRDRGPARATGRQWLAVAWLGLSDALNVALLFGAYRRTSVAVAVLTHYLTPVFVALAAPLVAGERWRGRTVVAATVAFGGLVLLLRPWSGSISPADLTGAAMGAASAIFYTSNVLVTKRLAPTFSGSELMFFHGLVATPLLFARVGTADYEGVTATSLALVVAGAVGPGAAGGLSFVWGLRAVPASHASVLTLLEPLVAVLLAAAALGEGVGAVAALGGALILGGAVLVLGDPPRAPAAD